MKKFELVPEKFIPCADGKLYQIRAVKSFTTSVGKHIHKGDFGGYIAREDNLRAVKQRFLAMHRLVEI